MEPKVEEALKAAGWQFGDYSEFLGMDAEETAEVERKIEVERDRRKMRKERRRGDDQRKR